MRSDLINWYLEQISNRIESEEELVAKKVLIEKVIERLIYHVSFMFITLDCKLSLK